MSPPPPSSGEQIALAEPSYWYIASSADQAFTSTFIARLVLHLRSIATTSAVSYGDALTSETLNGPKTGPRITVTVSDQQRRRHQPECQDDGCRCVDGERDDDEEWDAIEMHGWAPKKTALAPG